MWSSTVNNDSSINFVTEIAKDIPSKGNFFEDYNEFCKQFSILPCPYVKESVYINSESTNINVVKISSTIIDLSSWRAMLLAISTIGSKITEIIVYDACISGQHINDLKITMDKIGYFPVIKLEYITCKVPEGEELLSQSPNSPLYESFQLLLNGTSSIDYISLKGTKLTDDFIVTSKSSIQNNLTLQALNLNDTNITDNGLKELFTYLRVNPCLKQLSLSRNKNLTVSSLETISSFLISTVLVTPEEETIYKDFAKVVGDRNKAIKDKNKARKKANLPDLIELSNPSDRFFSINGEKKAINKMLTTIDYSYNGLYDTKSIQDFVELIESKAPDIVTVCGPINFNFIAKNDNSMNIDRLIIDEKLMMLTEKSITITINM